MAIAKGDMSFRVSHDKRFDGIYSTARGDERSLSNNHLGVIDLEIEQINRNR